MPLLKCLAPVSGWMVAPFSGAGHLEKGHTFGGVLGSVLDRWFLRAWEVDLSGSVALTLQEAGLGWRP